jgi:hypothetical protein
MNKEMFLNTRIQTQKVRVPEWDMDIFFRKWSAAERIRYTKEIVTGANAKGDVEIDSEKIFDQQIKMLQVTLCDEKGARIFDDSKDDYEILANKEADIIERLWEKTWEFNGMGQNEVADAAKNSETSQT